ncbi:MerR family transcriptional regulator [Limibaculum sp. M0105]|uniref:MerR family transcriptional regulator n=1 Tax=Thermohalobaculum xanthum TaxID=2753746 RepID=A0A8J7SAP8_9RHOB|nr:MerR family transcriptional regulator [Thermohalobaculum xanthum]MBK0398492.1 MerR family transcriptional regulator [Thermohalobaculum xanthum]
MRRRIDARRVKTHRAYRIDQLAEIVGVTVQTVRNWRRQGLPCITDKRPFLIRGRDFKEFHASRLKASKQALGAFEIFCLCCKRPRAPMPGLVDHEPMEGGRSRIIMICPHCERTAQRIVSDRNLTEWATRFEFAINRRGYD